MTELNLPAPRLVHLADAHMPITAMSAAVGTPLGDRAFGMVGGRWEGERLQADVLPPSADWIISTPGVSHTWVRLALRTDDGVSIFAEYRGRSVLDEATGIYTPTAAVGFEVSDPAYAWLNAVVAVGKGNVAGPTEDFPFGKVDYSFFEVT